MMFSNGGKWLIAVIAIYLLWYVVDVSSRYGDAFAVMIVISAAIVNQQQIVKEFNSVAAALR